MLTTTRAVRRRLDLERPVDNQLLLDCIDLAAQFGAQTISLQPGGPLIGRSDLTRDDAAELAIRLAAEPVRADRDQIVHPA